MFQGISKFVPLVALVAIAIQLKSSRVESTRGEANPNKQIDDQSENFDDTLTHSVEEPNLIDKIDNTAVREDLDDIPVTNSTEEPTLNGHIDITVPPLRVSYDQWLEYAESLEPTPTLRQLATDNFPDHDLQELPEYIEDPEMVFDLQGTTDEVPKLKELLQRANERLNFFRAYATRLEEEREDLQKRLWITHDDNENVNKMKQTMIREVAERAAAQINDRVKDIDGEWRNLSSMSRGVLTDKLDLSVSRCYAQHAALMGRLVIEARALSELLSSLRIGEVTMSQIRAVTQMSLGRLESLVAEAINVANNWVPPTGGPRFDLDLTWD